MNITFRLKAVELGVALAAVRTEVSLDRREPGKAAYSYRLEIDGQLTAEQRNALEEAASRCPVSQTLRRTPMLAAASDSVSNSGLNRVQDLDATLAEIARVSRPGAQLAFGPRTMIPSPWNVYNSAHPMTVGMRGSIEGLRELDARR
jgi:hypothetical protein